MPLLPRFDSIAEQRDWERKLKRLDLDRDDGEPAPTGTTAAGDPRRLRGLPAIGRNVTGARLDQDAVRALLAKERRRRRRR